MGITRAIALTLGAVATALTVNAFPAHAVKAIITSPSQGSPATVGTPFTASAETDGICDPTLQVRTPSGEQVKIGFGNAGPMCGPVTITGTFTPEASGEHQVLLVSGKGDTLRTVGLTAATPPAPVPTPTSTVTTTVTVTPSPTAGATESAAATPTPTPTTTIKVTLTPKASPSAKKAKPAPTVTRTVVKPAEQRHNPPQVVYIPAPTTEPQPSPSAPPITVMVQAPPAAQGQPTEMPAWMAVQLARSSDSNGPGFGTVFSALLAAMTVLCAAGVGGWMIFRRRGQRHNEL